MKTLLEVRNLHVAYGKVEAVHGVSLTVGEGRIVTVIGPNGAGKTTLLSAIMGLLPSRGAISLFGADTTRSPVEQRVAEGLCLVPERRELFAAMTVADNLELGAFQRYRSGDKAITAKVAVAWLLATALGAVGLGTGFNKLKGLGWKPFSVGMILRVVPAADADALGLPSMRTFQPAGVCAATPAARPMSASLRNAAS